MKKNPLHECYQKLPPKASVLDVGCLGFSQYKLAILLGRDDLRHAGVDNTLPDDVVPPGYRFEHTDLNESAIPFPDDSFDLVVASHVIEHLAKPVEFFGDLARVCRPGGKIYIEAPSERTLWLPGMPFAHDKFYSLSFFDDPTHTFRPWTPQAFHRLTRYYACIPITTGYHHSWRTRLLFPALVIYAMATRNWDLLVSGIWRAVGWAAYLIAEKPQDISGKPTFKYYIPTKR